MDKWLLWSDRGEGKTSTMVQMANELNRCGYAVTFISGSQEKLILNQDIIHLWSDKDNNNYTIAIIKEKAKLGRLDFLFIDDIELTNFKLVTTLEIPCNVVISASSYGSMPIKEKVPVSLIGKDNFLEIISDGKTLPIDFRFNQTFNSKKDIKYNDIISRYLRDKKIEQLI